MTAKLLRYRRFWIVFATLLALDQITKIAVRIELPRQGAVTVIPGFFWIDHVHNNGAAWSMFSNQQGILIVLALFALWALHRWRHTIGLTKPFVQVALGAFAAGAVGNVIDRSIYWHVTDFLRFRIPVIGYDWPVFNIADIGITVGAALYCWHGFTEKPAPKDGVPAKG